MALAEDNGVALAEDNGMALAEDNGMALAEDNGVALAEDNRVALAEENGVALAENKTVLTSEDWKERLLRNYKSLVHDIDLVGTLDGLFSEEVLTAEEKELVEKVLPNTTHNKNRHLLKIILQKTDSKFQIFLNGIEEIGHTQMTEQIKSKDISKLPVHSKESPKIINLRRKIFRNYDQIVGATSLIDLVDDFITDRIFEISEWEKITNAVPNTTDEKNRQFLDILLKKNYGYELFVDLLVQQGHSTLASKIKESIVDDKVENEIEYHLKNKDKDPLPDNIREQYQAILEKWKDENLVFYDTRATKSVTEAINKDPVIAVIGNGGTGKSAIIHHVALELYKKGYDVLPVSGPKEIHKYLQKNKKQAFVIDDPIGVHGLDKDKFKKWIDHDSKLEPSIAHGNTKILCSIRKQVCNESDFKRGKCILKRNLIDIQDEQHKLSDDEKIGMIKQHLQVNKSGLRITPEAETILKSTQELFPLLCKLFSSSEEFQRQSWNFFKNPFRLVLGDLENMQCTDKAKYCALVLCFAYENSLNLDIFIKFDKKSMQKFERYIMAFGVNINTLISSFTEISKPLLGAYLQKEGGIYKFSHDLIYDVVAFQFGSQHPEMVLKLGSSKFIRDRIAVSKETVQTEDPYTLILAPKYYTELANRLIDDLDTGIFNYVLMNKCWDDDGFMRAFEHIFNKQRTNKIQKLFQGKFERRKDILKVFLECSDRYRDEIKHEVQDMEQMGHVKMWSWYYTVIDILNTTGVTGLHWVVTFAHRTLFNLIWKNLSLTKKQRVMKKVPLLHLACLGGDKEICEVLLQIEHNKINSPIGDDGIGLTCQYPLHLAVCRNTDVVELLVEHGANISAKIDTGEPPIYSAAAFGNAQTVRALLKLGADINMCANDGFSPLYIATALQRVHAVEVLLKHGACSNMCEKIKGWGPLMVAVNNGDVKIGKLLLDNNADVDLCSYTGVSPLQQAVLKHYTAMAKLLLDNKARVNLCDKTGTTPLMCAVYNDRAELAKLLIEHNANVDVHDNNGYTALIMAIRNNNIAAVDLLLNQNTDVDLCQKDGNWSPLIIAVRDNNIVITKLLMVHGAKIDICENTKGWSSLMFAVHDNKTEMAKLILGYNADPDVCSYAGISPLLIAVQNNNIMMAKLLLDNKASVNLCDETGTTPLMRAVENDRMELAKLLLGHNANVDVHDNNGHTALILAIQKNNIAAVNLLLNQNTDVDLCQKDGNWSPLIIAVRDNNIVITKLLMVHGAKIDICENTKGWSSLMFAVHDNKTEMAKLILGHNADPDVCSYAGISPLLIAVQNNNIMMAKLLLDNKASVNLCDGMGTTPLMCAVDNDRMELAKLLLEHNANVDVHDSNGYTALIMAIQNNNIAAVNLLLNQNADVNLCQKDRNWSPLLFAVGDNNIVIAKLLMDHGAKIDICENTKGWNSLMFAVHNNKTEMAKLILEHNADPDVCSYAGLNPLMKAVQNNNIMMVKLLLKNSKCQSV